MDNTPNLKKQFFLSMNSLNLTREKTKEYKYDRFIVKKELEPDSFKYINFSENKTKTSYDKCLSNRLIFQSPLLNESKRFKENNFSLNSNLKSVFVDNKLNNNVQRNINFNNFMIAGQESRSLDAPDVVSDFYLTILAWSPKNILAVALKGNIYFWDENNKAVLKNIETDDEDYYITSLIWINDGDTLIIGGSNGDIRVFDMNIDKIIRILESHEARVCSLSSNEEILTSGGRDSQIFHHDLRIKNHCIGNLRMHKQEVCGLQWNNNQKTLASGGNDNLICIWEKGYSNPRLVKNDYKSAVKALSWCPKNNTILVSGGGLVDPKLMITNSISGKTIRQIDTQSQITSILWSESCNEIITSHGSGKNPNRINIWQYETLKNTASLLAHEDRIISLAMCPYFEKIASISSDEILKFWTIYQNKQIKEFNISQAFNNSNIIR
jgi:WD40 repeat protein